MKILIWSEHKNNQGPDNINKGIIGNLTDQFCYVPVQGKYRQFLVALRKLLQSDVLLVSGASRKGALLVLAAKLINKKSVYIMHGCREAEYRLNGIKSNNRALAEEAFLLKHADLLLPVSKRYMEWAKKQYPQYAHKMDYVYNGIDTYLFEYREERTIQPGSVAVAGGMDPLKNNRIVIQAVESLCGKAELRIYGGHKDPCVKNQYTEWMGKLGNEEFLACLATTELFVLNSRLESFSIATMEAFACGCSLLVSEVAGVCDLLALEETDIIHDPMDVEEIRGKIAYLLDHPNYERLRGQFDPEQWSFAKMVENLEHKCEMLLISSGK